VALLRATYEFPFPFPRGPSTGNGKRERPIDRPDGNPAARSLLASRLGVFSRGKPKPHLRGDHRADARVASRYGGAGQLRAGAPAWTPMELRG